MGDCHPSQHAHYLLHSLGNLNLTVAPCSSSPRKLTKLLTIHADRCLPSAMSARLGTSSQPCQPHCGLHGQPESPVYEPPEMHHSPSWNLPTSLRLMSLQECFHGHFRAVVWMFSSPPPCPLMHELASLNAMRIPTTCWRWSSAKDTAS